MEIFLLGRGVGHFHSKVTCMLVVFLGCKIMVLVFRIGLENFVQK